MVEYIHTLNVLRSAHREERLMWKIWQGRTSNCSSAVREKHHCSTGKYSDILHTVCIQPRQSTERSMKQYK